MSAFDEELAQMRSWQSFYHSLASVFYSLPDAPSVVAGRVGFVFLAERLQLFLSSRKRLTTPEFENLRDLSGELNHRIVDIFNQWGELSPHGRNLVRLFVVVFASGSNFDSQRFSAQAKKAHHSVTIKSVKALIALETKYFDLKSPSEIRSSAVSNVLAALSSFCRAVWVDNFGEVPYVELEKLLDVLPHPLSRETRAHLRYLFDSLDFQHCTVFDFSEIMLAFAMPNYEAMGAKIAEILGDKAFVGDVTDEVIYIYRVFQTPFVIRLRFVTFNEERLLD
jgi:hypothetical protein